MMNAESDGAFVVIWFVSLSQPRVELLTSVLCISRPGVDSVTADVTGDVTAQLHECHLEVSQRFPGLSVELLVDAIMRAHTEPMTRTDLLFLLVWRTAPLHAENKRGARTGCSWPATVYAEATNQHRWSRNGIRPGKFRDAYGSTVPSAPEVAERCTDSGSWCVSRVGGTQITDWA